jgi:DNA-binding XRE family transcriptional regulator
MRLLRRSTPSSCEPGKNTHCDAHLDIMTSQEIGRQLRARRKFLRLRQRDLAELAGVTLRGLTDLENGRGNPTVKQLAKIGEVLGLELTLVERSGHAPS